MKAIRTTRQPNYLIRVTDGDSVKVYPIDDLIENDDKQHANAVKRFCQHKGWNGRLIGGTMQNNGKFVCMVWVFDDSADKYPLSPVVEIPGTLRCNP